MSFTYETKSVWAHHSRAAGSVLQPDDRLVVVYAKYAAKVTDPAKRTVNLLMAHATGMNKSVWRYHVEQLYALSQGRAWQLGTVLAYDAVSHGDSAVANDGKLGAVFDWADNAKDMLCVLKNEPLVVDSGGDSITISVGHSFGGYAVVYGAFLEPVLFDSVITIDPVIASRIDFKTPDMAKIYGKMLKLLERAIQTDFPDLESFTAFMTKKSFCKNFHPEVLKHYLADERRFVNDTQVSAKCSKKQQLVLYGGASEAMHRAMPMLPFVSVPVVHVMGANSTWNDPDFARSHLRATIPQCEGVEIEDGEHLVPYEMPDATIAVILAHVDKAVSRCSKTKETVLTAPERDALFVKRYEAVFAGYQELMKGKL